MVKVEKVVSYLRVSTNKQLKSGLGLEAQREKVAQYVAGAGAEFLEEFLEAETGKGADALSKRPQLKAAIKFAKENKAVLVIAKLDRLARNVHFVSGLLETGVQFKCCDYPEADRTMLHIYAVMAEHEGRRISERITDALAAKRARKEVLGNAASLKPFNGVRAAGAAEFAKTVYPTIQAFQQQGLAQRAIVDRLNQVGIKTANGGEWGLIQLQRVIVRARTATA
jgi:DNA invertase Pin-like site-specific DNA recombinase